MPTFETIFMGVIGTLFALFFINMLIDTFFGIDIAELIRKKVYKE